MTICQTIFIRKPCQKMTRFGKSKVERREGGGGSERRSRREMCTNTPERAHSTSAPSSHDLSTLAASVVSAICAVQAPANTPAQHAAHVLEGSACTAPPEAVTPPQTEEEDEMVVVSAPEQGESAHATSQEDQREERASRKRALADLSDPFEEGAILDYLVPAKRERNARRKTKKARKQDQGTAWAVQVMESKGEGDQREVKIWYLVPDPEHPEDLSKRQPLEKEICRKRIVWQSPGWVKVTDPCLRRPKQDVAREQKAKKQKARNEKKEEALQKKEQKQAAKLAAAAAKAGVPVPQQVAEIMEKEDAKLEGIASKITAAPRAPRGKNKTVEKPNNAVQASRNVHKYEPELFKKAAQFSEVINQPGELSADRSCNTIFALSVQHKPPEKVGMPGRLGKENAKNPAVKDQTIVTAFLPQGSPFSVNDIANFVMQLGTEKDRILLRSEADVARHVEHQKASRGFPTAAGREEASRLQVLQTTPEKKRVQGPAMSASP